MAMAVNGGPSPLPPHTQLMISLLSNYDHYGPQGRARDQPSHAMGPYAHAPVIFRGPWRT